GQGSCPADVACLLAEVLCYLDMKIHVALVLRSTPKVIAQQVDKLLNLLKMTPLHDHRRFTWTSVEVWLTFGKPGVPAGVMLSLLTLNHGVMPMVISNHVALQVPGLNGLADLIEENNGEQHVGGLRERVRAALEAFTPARMREESRGIVQEYLSDRRK